MSAIYIALFFVGMVIAFVVKVFETPQRKVPHSPSRATKLDTTDEMFLYGEVTGDDFYRM